MQLTIVRRQHNGDMFQYNERTHATDDDNMILDFLNCYDGDGNVREWIEDNLKEIPVLHNCMSLGYDANNSNIIDYYVVFDNDKTKTSFKC